MADNIQSYTAILLKRIHESRFPSEKILLVAGKDDQKFPIDRNVLSAASEYIAASLGSNFQENRKSEFVLRGADGETVKTIVDYCYTGKINLDGENVGRFLAIASSFELDLLERECRRYYERNLSLNNCVEALMIADKYSHADLRQKALKLVCGSFENVPATDVHKLDPRIFQDLLKSEKIQATEELVFTRLMEWFHSNEVDHKTFMSQLLKLIRLDLMTEQFLKSGTLEMVYRRFKGSKLLFAEIKRRTSGNCTNVSTRRFGSIFCLFTRFKNDGDAGLSAIKIEKFDTAQSTFKEAGEIAMGDRTHFSVVLLRDKIFALGGMVNGECLKSASAFDLNTGEEEALPEMNVARRSFATISCGKYIYVFGGLNSSGVLKSCERFDIEAKVWKVIAEMNYAKCRHFATRLYEHFCIAGGSFNDIFFGNIELYDPSKNEWTESVPHSKPRIHFAITQINESLYVMGIDATIERLDPWRFRWVEAGSIKVRGNISNAINIDGECFAICGNGQFGRITVDVKGACSFHPLGRSNNQSAMQRHFLYKN